MTRLAIGAGVIALVCMFGVSAAYLCAGVFVFVAMVLRRFS